MTTMKQLVSQIEDQKKLVSQIEDQKSKIYDLVQSMESFMNTLYVREAELIVKNVPPDREAHHVAQVILDNKHGICQYRLQSHHLRIMELILAKMLDKLPHAEKHDDEKEEQEKCF